MQSFPSGHAASSFAAALFVTLYMNAKLKTFADFESTSWSIVFTLAPLVLAFAIAGGLVLEHVSLSIACVTLTLTIYTAPSPRRCYLRRHHRLGLRRISLSQFLCLIA
jgi:hypothetical protein